MVDLTVLIITKNEENNLRKCVESFRGIAKRFVVIDSYSTDRTKELCVTLNKELNGKLDFYENKFIDHATQINWGLNNTQITTDWTMRIDADEEITAELAKEIEARLNELGSAINGVILRRRVYFMGKWIKHGGRYPELLLRIFRTGKGICEQKVMDEHIMITEGKLIKFQYDFIDNNSKDLEWWTNKHNWYSNREVLDHQMTLDKLNSQQQIKNKNTSKQALVKRVFKNHGYYGLPKFFRAHFYFIYRYYIKLGFLDGEEGKIFHFLQAYWYRFLVDAKIYECKKFSRTIKKQGDLKA